MKKFFLLFLLFYGGNDLPAQVKSEIKGYVIDAATNDSIAFCTITLYNYSRPFPHRKKPVLTTAVLADYKGYFDFKNLSPGKYIVEVKMTGYQVGRTAIILTPGKITWQNFFLKLLTVGF